MDKKFTVDELRANVSQLTDEIKAVDEQFAGRELSPEAREKFDALKEEREAALKLIAELEERAKFIADLEGRADNTEAEPKFASFQTRQRRVVPDDPTKLEEYRTNARSLDDLEQGYRDGARMLVESKYRHAHPSVSREEAQKDADKLIEIDREVALRMITTSTPGYKREFGTYIATGQVGPEMLRTASLTTTAGGFAVPVELDTTLILANAGVVNPVRRLARVRQTNVNTVEFINTTGITAGFGAEATEASDNAPTLAQPTVNIEKAFAFVPMSIEIASDWANVQGDMAMAFADSKDQLEASKFLTGLGHTSHEPQGLIAVGGATAVVTTATTAVFAVADLYSLEIGLSPRYRTRATIVGNRATFQKVRQFASNGVNIWTQLPGPDPATLLGYPVEEWSNYAATPSTSGSTILTIGDFNYFAIVDRVGASVEFIPHLFGSSNRYPTGQRGLYYWWRTSSQVLTPTLQSQSAFVSLKVL